MATEDILNNNSSAPFMAHIKGGEYNMTAQYMHASALAKNLTRLEVSDCLTAYGTTFQTSHGSLILVTNDTNFASTTYYDNNMWYVYGEESGGCSPDPFGWMCGNERFFYCPYNDEPQGACSISVIDSTDWKPFGSTVEYCLSEPVQQHCRVQFTPQVAYTVIVFNLAKALILLFTFFFIKENPLMTVGDAISSFLHRRDETTKRLCLMSKEDISWWKRPSAYPLTSTGPTPRPLIVTPKRWSSVVSRRRWTTVIIL
jgi:hypothetical protein